jgi:hypothetical protein
MPAAERTATLNQFIDGKLPYEALKKLRTLVGREMADSSIVSDVPRSKWTALYGALVEGHGRRGRGLRTGSVSRRGSARTPSPRPA